jgi:uncharacterized protein YbcC (UPF0753/DUF2309 family)
MAVATEERGGVQNEDDSRARRLQRVIGYAAHLLPAQGPISIFVHHNTLHAYEYVPFEAAVVEAAELFGCAPFLSEAEYRRELARGRILVSDLENVLAHDLGSRAQEPIGALTTRMQLQLGLLRDGVRDLRGAALEWTLAETGTGRPQPEERNEIGRGCFANDRNGASRLWEVCVSAAERHVEEPPPRRRTPARLRDLLLAVKGVDPDALVHPVLIRFCAAFLDQGIAYWPMPDRERGLYPAFRRLFRSRTSVAEAWMRPLAAELETQEQSGTSASDVVLNSLDLFGIPEREWEVFLSATLLTLRGWAGMIHQIEVRPDRVPVQALPARLVDFLAVRLLLDRFAALRLAHDHLAWDGPLSDLRAVLKTQLAPAAARSVHERAWPLFEMSRIHGWRADQLSALSAVEVGALLGEYDRFDENARCRLLHLAYERRHRVQVLDALCAHSADVPAEPKAPVRLQTVHCIDEREESLRRHIEEVEPGCETFGTAGFFGIAMYYRGVSDAHPTPLCPIAIRPQHEVEEAAVDESLSEHMRRQARRRWLGLLTYETRLASRTFTRGALVSFVLGLGAAIPLTFRVLLPRWTARVHRETSRLMQAPARSRLLLERSDRPVMLGPHSGFTIEEMAEIVARVLVDIGLTHRFAPLVAIVGHGSSSLNNPHESAHDCGACGGGRGGPNARAFARMANDPRVRALLAARGIGIPATTYFVGAYHNTCDDMVDCFDSDEIPASHASALALLRQVVEEARARTAHERCRRFDSAPLSLSPRQALAHVEARSEDLAQPRPEYGHATNAVCIIGRRGRTRGLFLDRRAFLVSYDPETDDASGSILARVLDSVVPVVAGINLEYYFSRVDPSGYGCATKLPHNITALLGVMDGHASDLRTGLPWQMVEIHEPVRLLVLVETGPDLLRRVVAQNGDLARLVQNQWIQMGAWTPDAAETWLFTRRGLVRHEPESTELPRVARSADWYGGRRDFLPCARVVATAGDLA